MLGADAEIELALEPLNDVVTTAESIAPKRAGPAGRRILQVISCLRPRCPRCGSTSMEKYRSVADQGDGTSLWWMRCTALRCGHRFKVVYE